jgi:hypothetical protein
VSLRRRLRLATDAEKNWHGGSAVRQAKRWRIREKHRAERSPWLIFLRNVRLFIMGPRPPQLVARQLALAMWLQSHLLNAILTYRRKSRRLIMQSNEAPPLRLLTKQLKQISQGVDISGKPNFCTVFDAPFGIHMNGGGTGAQAWEASDESGSTVFQ